MEYFNYFYFVIKDFNKRKNTFARAKIERGKLQAQILYNAQQNQIYSILEVFTPVYCKSKHS